MGGLASVSEFNLQGIQIYIFFLFYSGGVGGGGGGWRAR